MPILMIFFIIATASAQAAQYYQCTDASGHKAFQQTPCAHNTQQEIKENASQGNFIDNTNSSIETYQQIKDANDQRQRQREIRKTQQKIDSIEQRRQQHLLKLRQQKDNANNNLAGATWEQAISTEMQSINQAYDSMLKTERDYLQRLYEVQDSNK